jgi:hypothetical protein
MRPRGGRERRSERERLILARRILVTSCCRRWAGVKEIGSGRETEGSINQSWPSSRFVLSFSRSCLDGAIIRTADSFSLCVVPPEHKVRFGCSLDLSLLPCSSLYIACIHQSHSFDSLLSSFLTLTCIQTLQYEKKKKQNKARISARTPATLTR